MMARFHEIVRRAFAVLSLRNPSRDEERQEELLARFLFAEAADDELLDEYLATLP